MQHRQFRCALVSCAVAIGESGEIRWCHFDADGTSNTIDVVAVTVCRSANGNLFFFFFNFPHRMEPCNVCHISIGNETEINFDFFECTSHYDHWRHQSATSARPCRLSACRSHAIPSEKCLTAHIFLISFVSSIIIISSIQRQSFLFRIRTGHSCSFTILWDSSSEFQASCRPCEYARFDLIDIKKLIKSVRQRAHRTQNALINRFDSMRFRCGRRRRFFHPLCCFISFK